MPGAASMERGRVKKILLFCRDIDGEINLKKNVLRDYEGFYYASGGAGALDGMPRGKHGAASPTEAIVLNVPDSAYKTMQEMRDDIERLAALKAAILGELGGLPLAYKRILYDFYIKGMQWVRISERVRYSPTQCKELRNRGLDILAGRFADNDLIKSFSYPR
jgi:hypothetical protein